jgi:transcriptional regulator with XRE-family HTH domain
MNPNQAKRLGAYLRNEREHAGLSQARLAKLVGVDNSRILRLERGDTLSPNADFLSQIVDALGLNLFDVYARAGYAAPDHLPALTPYLRTKYRDLPESATAAIATYAERLAKRHGVDLRGPAPGEDESREPVTTKSTKKGGTSHATRNRSKY